MTNVLASIDTATSLWAIGRSIAPPGAPGISRQARALTQTYLSQSASGANQLFSSTAGSSYASIEDLQTMIKGLRARLPQSQISDALKGEEAQESTTLMQAAEAEKAAKDAGNIKTANQMLADLVRGSVFDVKA